jgi:N-terminal half of MaoC dehydratase
MYITPDIRSLIGRKGPVRSAAEPLSRDQLRRFNQAAMELDIPSPPFTDEDSAAPRDPAETAPPLWPLHAFVRAADEPDPFDVLRHDPELDGTHGTGETGLPPVDLPLARILNGGVSAEFFAQAEVGDVIHAQSEYADIAEREGRSGPMVIVAIATTYTNQRGRLLCRVTNSFIRR